MVPSGHDARTAQDGDRPLPGHPHRRQAGPSWRRSPKRPAGLLRAWLTAHPARRTDIAARTIIIIIIIIAVIVIVIITVDETAAAWGSGSGKGWWGLRGGGGFRGVAPQLRCSRGAARQALATAPRWGPGWDGSRGLAALWPESRELGGHPVAGGPGVAAQGAARS